MDLNTAREAIAQYVKEQFGIVCDLREVSVERSTSGRVFTGDVYCVTKKGDVYVGKVGVSEDGEVVRELSADDLTEALIAVGYEASAVPPNNVEQDFSLLSDDDDDDVLPNELEGFIDSGEDANEIKLFFSEFNSVDVMQRIIGLLTSGDRADLLKARQLMPRLLVDHEKRGLVLMYMGELEIRLGEIQLALNYLEAAACEFADVGDLPSLERAVSLAKLALPEEALAEHPTTRLLNQTLARLKPIENLAEVPAFSSLSAEEMAQISTVAERVTVDAGEIILKEGDPATQAFVIQSGILGINLETPGGTSRTVRCCFPGELVGESCVQGPGATCNATVYTKQASTLYRFPGETLISLTEHIPIIMERLEASRTIHRLDSFFSMNAATLTLDVRVRDRLIGCITAIRQVAPQTVIEQANTDPTGVYLVVRGQLVKRLEGEKERTFGPDDFVCIRETLHKLPLEGDVVAETETQLVVFDTAALFELAMAAPPELAAVLDRLE